MANLELALFTNGQRDLEQSQYEVMAALNRNREAFRKNRVYPHLTDLIELHRTLGVLLTKGPAARESIPGRISGIDWDSHSIVYREQNIPEEASMVFGDLIEWSMPQIHRAIHEGKTICRFVEENMTVTEVGVLPSNVEQGYLLMPDQSETRFRVIRYEVSVFTGGSERYRSLATHMVRYGDLDYFELEPSDVRSRLIKEYREWPDPATFCLNTELDFPLQQTLLPLAKRKLLKAIHC